MTGEKKERRQAFPGAGLVFEKNLVRVDALRSHERTRRRRVTAVKRGIALSRSVLQPLVVDAASFVVLDGHHRLQALRELGCRLAPVRFVDYASESVKVKPRRKRVAVSKELVLGKALAGETFPCKTTRHEHPLKKAPASATRLEELK